MCVPHDDFININQLNWNSIFCHLFAKSDVAPEDLIPVETIEDNGILQDCRYVSGILYKRIGKFQFIYPLSWQSYSVKYCLWQNCSLEKSSAFLVTVSLYNADCHWKKSIYVAFKYYNFNEGSNKFYKTNFLTLNHCEVMGMVLDINNYLKNGRWELQSGKKRAKIDSETSSFKLLVENDTQTITQNEEQNDNWSLWMALLHEYFTDENTVNVFITLKR